MSDPGRILVVNHAARMGGAEMILLDLAAAWGDRCEVVLFADGPFRAALQARGVAVRVLEAGRGMMGVTREAGRLRALASVPAVGQQVGRLAAVARRFDLLYANSQKAAVVAMLVAAMLRKPLVWHMHDILSDEHFAALQRRMSVRLANRLGVRVVVISEAAKRSFLAVGGRPDRVQVVPNGVDARVYAPDAVTAAPAEAFRPAAPAVAHTVGLFGRISPWKGQHVLIEAIGRSPPGIGAVLVGDALFGEDGYRRGLDETASRLGVADRVRFLGHRDDVPSLMRAVDLVVHCSTSPEPFGRVIVEAMLLRRPVIASADGASAEILGADYPWLVAPGDAAALADAIGRLLALDDAARDALLDRNASRAAARYTLPTMIGGIDDVLRAAA